MNRIKLIFNLLIKTIFIVDYQKQGLDLRHDRDGADARHRDPRSNTDSNLKEVIFNPKSERVRESERVSERERARE